MEQLLRVQHHFVPGWLDPMEGNCLQWMTSILPQGSIAVETGSFAGLSTRYMALGCELSKSNLYAVDLYSGQMPGEEQYFGKEFFDNASWLIQDQGEALVRMALQPFGPGAKRVNIVRGDAVKVGKNWRHGPVDFIFIDDNHEKCRHTTSAWLDRLAKHAMIAFHDVHEVKTYGPDGPLNTLATLQLRGWKLYARVGLIGLATRDPEWWNLRARAVRDLFDAVAGSDPNRWNQFVSPNDAGAVSAGAGDGDDVRGPAADHGDGGQAAGRPQEKPTTQ